MWPNVHFKKAGLMCSPCVEMVREENDVCLKLVTAYNRRLPGGNIILFSVFTLPSFSFQLLQGSSPILLAGSPDALMYRETQENAVPVCLDNPSVRPHVFLLTR